MSDITEPDDLLGMLPDEIIAAFTAERAAREAAEQQIAALRKAGEALWVELEDATFGFDTVHWKVQPNAQPALDAWRAVVEGKEA